MANSAPKSVSVQQREKGNAFYKSAMVDGSIFSSLMLRAALQCYTKSLYWKNNEDEEVSAVKNIGITSWKLASVYIKSAPVKETKNIHKYFGKALQFLGLAYKKKSCKSVSWGQKLEDSWYDCMKEARIWLKTLDTKERNAGFIELLDHVPDCTLKAVGYVVHTHDLFLNGLLAWHSGEYKGCHWYMKECYYPIQEADRLSSQHPSIKTKVNVLREDVSIRTCMAESMIAQGSEGPKAKASASVSSFNREAGNIDFRSACDERSNHMKYVKYKGALQFYRLAYSFASEDEEDTVSAAKNTAITHWRLAGLMQVTGGPSDKKVIGDHFKDALQYFSKAYLKRNCRGQAWAEHLEKAMQDCFDDIRTWIAPEDKDDRIEAMEEYLGYLPACGAKVSGYLFITNIYLKKGKEALKCDKYENCQRYLKECRVALAEAEKICTNEDPSIQMSVDALKKSVEYHEGLVKRYIARVKDLEARFQRERAEESAKKVAMDQLKADIKDLDLFSKLPVEDFVKQVYQRWPPKGSNGPNLPSSSSSSSLSSSAASKKKLLIRAISHYHPDKVDKNVHGIKWHLLSCEITKSLNVRLASTK